MACSRNHRAPLRLRYGVGFPHFPGVAGRHTGLNQCNCRTRPRRRWRKLSFSNPQPASELTPERSLIVFVEIDKRHTDGFTVSLHWDRDTGQTQIVVNDARTASETVFGVPHVNAADAFRHPFRYAP